MKKYDKIVKNAAGKDVPTIINGEDHIPFKGVGKYKPTGRRYGPKLSSCADYPSDGNKVLKGSSRGIDTSRPERWYDHFNASPFPQWRLNCQSNI